MKIIRASVILLIIVYMWIWLINSIFVDKKIKNKLIFKIFISVLIMVWSLFIYRYVLENLWLANIYFANILNISNIAIFIIYCMFFVLLNLLIYQNISHKKLWISIILWIILFLMVGYGGYYMWISIILMYYFLAAYAEEIMKFIWWQSIFSKEGQNKSDLIYFCILIGLAFSIVENFLYIWYNAFQEVNLVWLSLGRWLVSSLLHIVSTGVVSYFAIKWYQNNEKLWDKSNTKKIINKKIWFILFVLLGMVLGFGIHSIYNISLFYNWKLLSLSFIIIWYFVFSFLMFKSDRIYTHTT